jgi:hypothetical protein
MSFKNPEPIFYPPPPAPLQDPVDTTDRPRTRPNSSAASSPENHLAGLRPTPEAVWPGRLALLQAPSTTK